MKQLAIVALSVLIITPLEAAPLYETTPEYLAQRVAGTAFNSADEGNPEDRYTSAGTSSLAGVPDYEVIFTSAAQWLSGQPNFVAGWRLPSGLSTFTGSAVADSEVMPIQIIFSNTATTQCATFRRDLGYSNNGVGLFPGTAWDMSDTANPRQLNLCFVEDNNQAPFNNIWDPGTNNVGNREYLFVMQSSYDGTGLTYAGNNILSDGSTMDIQWFFWPRVQTGLSLLQTLPATVDISLYYVKNVRVIPDSTQNIFTWTYEDGNPDHFNIYAGPVSPPPLLATVPGSARSYTHTSLTTGVEYYYYAEAATASDSAVGRSRQVSAVAEAVSSNMNLAGFLHEYGTYGDVWGYTSGGTEYALICARNLGVSIIDVTANPPVEVGFINPTTAGVDSKDVKIYQNYAILVNEGDDIQIYDLTDVTNPTLTGTFTPDGGGAHNCIVEGNYLYVIGNHGIGGLEIVDISNPASPVEVGSFQPFYYHDIDIRNDTIIATGIYGDGIDLIDVSNKNAPTLIARFNYPGSGAHNAEFSADGSHVFIGDEIGTGNYIRAFNISDPGNVTLVSTMIIDTNQPVHNCYLLNDTLLAIAHYTLGMRIWNVVNPASPFEVAYYDTHPAPGAGYMGCWSVYTDFASGKLIASDMQTGLYVLDPAFVACTDSDGDGVCDGADQCPGFNDLADADSDGVPDGCDICSGFDDLVDADSDGVPDGCDICAGSDDLVDSDSDGVPDGCDACPGFNDFADADTDGVADGCDNCPDDFNPGQEDANNNGVGDACDACPIVVTGDVDISGTLTSTDIIAMVNYVFKGGLDPLPCPAAADVNCSGTVTSADIIFMVGHVFKSGPPPCDICLHIPSIWTCP